MSAQRAGYAEVIVNVPAAAVDRVFHYRIPPTLAGVKVGARVRVPFGRRVVEGFVLALREQADLPPEKVKELLAVEEGPHLEAGFLALARWLAEYYGCLLIEALTTVLPPWVTEKTTPMIPLVQIVEGAETLKAEARQEASGTGEALGVIARLARRAPKQAEVLAWLQAAGSPCPLPEVLAACGVSRATVTALIQKGLVRLTPRRRERRPETGLGRERTEPPSLTPDQARAVAEIVAATQRRGKPTGKGGGAFGATAPSVFLLHGVTGSGKTEVYLQAIAAVREQGGGAIVLVPEIALTPQMVERFRSRFGEEVAILHSHLGAGERHDEWQRLYRGEARIVVGARSAVFAPVADLALIIIDEEHEPSYKQEVSPRYHAREVALARARESGVTVVLGSATPSIESYWRARQGEYRLLELPSRIGDAPLPSVRVVDMRREAQAGNRSVFSRPLLEKLAARLERGEQTILFLNRRGYTTVVLCRECGYVEECSQCAIPLTYHRESHSLRCHYCNQQRLVPALCPACGSRYLRHFGLGTERVEEAVRRHFPGARVLRMDLDTTRTRGAHSRILAAFQRGEAEILVGTQMIAKGLDFPRVTLVGVIAADLTLHLQDFRAAERTFQLLTQVAGRAGRGPLGGEVIIQTFFPEHYSIQASVNHDYRAFFAQELRFRARQGYPPFKELVNVTVSGEEEQVVAKVARDLGEAVREAACVVAPQAGVEVYGPSPAPLARVRGQYRYRLFLKGENLAILRAAASQGMAAVRWPRGAVTVVMDVQPQSML